ncbi:CbiX protein [Delftia acidovorans]|uniref:sirohydrochlorin chelatase n=1 Tax=Delftia acidovorans TaxID=80866 RepID=UPI000F9209C8|nr:CbiX/SirB N-terminal domain-containing protein [Delftia acidovorans]ROQ92553.1 CbiX protein [Delftia acidovorans]
MNSSETSIPPGPDAVIVLGRGGTGAASRQSLIELADALRPTLEPGCKVVTSFVDKAAPSLPEALQQCLPARSIVVLPLFSPDEPALLRWLHKLAMRWRSQLPDQGVQVRFADHLLGAPAMPALLLPQIRQALQTPDIAETAGDQWQHDPQAWSQVPDHQHHALVCTGPRCTALGAWPSGKAWARPCRPAANCVPGCACCRPAASTPATMARWPSSIRTASGTGGSRPRMPPK